MLGTATLAITPPKQRNSSIQSVPTLEKGGQEYLDNFPQTPIKLGTTSYSIAPDHVGTKELLQCLRAHKIKKQILRPSEEAASRTDSQTSKVRV